MEACKDKKEADLCRRVCAAQRRRRQVLTVQSQASQGVAGDGWSRGGGISLLAVDGAAEEEEGGGAVTSALH